MSSSASPIPTPPPTMSKYLHSLPPSYIAHLRLLIHQWLQDQLAPPDEGLPGPSNRVADRQLWSDNRLIEVERAVLSCILGDGTEEREGILGCDWAEWAKGGVKRKKAYKREIDKGKEKSLGEKVQVVVETGTTKGIGFKLPVHLPLPSGLGSVVSTPTRSSRPASVASSTRSRDTSPAKDKARGEDAEHIHNQTIDGLNIEAAEIIREWCETVRQLKGFVPFDPCATQRESWEVLNDDLPAQTPIRDFPGAFPQAPSSSCFPTLPSAPSPTGPVPPPLVPLTEMIKPIICLSFVPAQSRYEGGSTRSHSTVRLARQSSGDGSRTTASEVKGVEEQRQGSGGLGGLGGWFGSKWSEMTVGAEEGRVEIEFIRGKWALPVPFQTDPQGSSGRRKSSMGGTELSEDDDAETGSTWSDTETGHGDGQGEGRQAVNLIVSGHELDVPLEAVVRGEVGIVGGTIVVRGMRREEERKGLEKVFRGIIYAIQSQIIELSLLEAFSIPPEPLPPPPPPPKPVPTRKRTAELPSSIPGLGRTNSQSKRGFLAKLGLDKGRESWSGFLGRRRGSSGATRLLGTNKTDDEGVDDSVPSYPQSPTYTASALPPLPTSSTHARQANHNLTGIQRHLQLLADLREMQHSTTPGLRFDLPPILERVEAEDRIRRIKAGEETGHPDSNSTLFGTSVISTATTSSMVSRGYNGLPLPPLPTSSNSLGLPFSLPGAAIGSDEIKGRAMAYRLGGDIRSGLQSLGGALEGWEGFWRLQRLEYLSWTGVEEETTPSDRVEDVEQLEKKPVPAGSYQEEKKERLGDIAKIRREKKEIIACTKPTASTHRFYDPSTDLSIEDYLSNLAEELGLSACGPGYPTLRSSPMKRSTELSDTSSPSEAALTTDKEGHQSQNQSQIPNRLPAESDSDDTWENVCPRSRCTASEVDHVRVWAAGGRRVVCQIRKKEEPERRNDEQDLGGLEVWVECASCGERTESRPLREGVSWNKFLELILFSRKLIPSICPHTTPSNPLDPAEVIYHVSHPFFSLSLRPSAQQVYEARLPKLQVGPSVAKRKTGSEAARNAVEAFAKRKTGPPGVDGMDTSGTQRDHSPDGQNGLVGWKVNMEGYLRELLEHVPPLPPPKTASDPMTDMKDPKDFFGRTARLDLLAIQTDLAGLSSTHSPVDRNGNDIPAFTSHEDRAACERIAEAVIAWTKEYKLDTPSSIPTLPALEQNEGKGLKLPGSNTVIRDDEPASVIAYTLSSLAYFSELCGGTPKSSSTDQAGPYNLVLSDGWTVEVSRRDTPRDILPLRTLNKKRSEISLPSARLPLAVTPLQPSLELNLQPVVGHLGHESVSGMDDLVKSISKATSGGLSTVTTPTGLPNRPASAGPTGTASSSESDNERLDMENALASTPRIRRKVTGDAPPSSYRRTVSASVSLTSSPRLTPASPGRTPPRPSVQTTHQRTVSGIPSPSPANSAVSTPKLNEGTATTLDKDKEGWGSVTSSFASSFNTILKLSSGMTDSLTSRVRTTTSGDSRSLASFMAPLLSSDNSPTDDRPHIHLSLSHHDYKISCTVYYAQAFDTLRRRCAFDKSFVRSLEQTIGWSAEGGKSKASFWKTQDGRLVVKSLVSKWNVSDSQTLLEIAPAYFEHMSTTHNKATALAKIVGFYSVRIHDVKTNEKRTMDLLVMENLFWKQDIDRIFDLKGIEGRKLPKGRENESTKFDGEWLDQQATTPLLIHPHAKRIILDSLTTDTRFLSSQSIMDYSLLLGLDQGRSELVIGLVDAVGSYGLFKNIESMGKMALNRGREGEVTIIPPDQYRERFETALKTYFTACPDKWSRSVQRVAGISVDPPSIF